MSLRLEMLQVAKLAPRLLGESAELVASFLRQQGEGGAFVNRAGAADLYYTVFGLEALAAVGHSADVGATAKYLRSVGDGSSLDFVHACCLARCWANMPVEVRPEAPAGAIVRHMEDFRSGDGGYHATTGRQRGTIYGCFLAAGAYEDLGEPMPSPRRMLECINALRADDGGYANQDDLPLGATPATAAAVAMLRRLGETPPAGLEAWLMDRCHAEGGFYAVPAAPMPDLLSTATALHALSMMHADISAIREPCLNFIDSLWTNRGGFYGSWMDDAVDVEYTYYGLLALGHLSELVRTMSGTDP